MTGKNRLAIGIGIISFFLSTTPAFAHIIVSPSRVGIAAIQDFTINVPNEKDNPVTAIKLLIPNGLNSVVPDAISGWTIETKTNGSGDNATVNEIDWAGGNIPAGQRQEFVFQAQAPAQPTTLNWKAYQIYSDGTVVSWDIDPVKMEKLSDEQQDQLADKENKGEYSTTQVINDLAETNSMSKNTNTANVNTWAIILGALGSITGGASLLLQLQKKK